MPQDGILKTNSLDKLVISALDDPDNRTPQQAAERMLAELHSALHMVVPPPSENENLYGRDAQFTPQPTMPTPSANPTHVRRVYLGNDVFTLYGMSDAEIAAKEFALRKLYE